MASNESKNEKPKTRPGNGGRGNYIRKRNWNKLKK